MVKNLPAMQEIQSLCQEDPLEEGMVTHSSTLAWKIPWIEESGRLQSMGLQTVGYDCVTNTPWNNASRRTIMKLQMRDTHDIKSSSNHIKNGKKQIKTH